MDLGGVVSGDAWVSLVSFMHDMDSMDFASTEACTFDAYGVCCTPMSSVEVSSLRWNEILGGQPETEDSSCIMRVLCGCIAWEGQTLQKHISMHPPKLDDDGHDK